jgi:hypothetical protein
MFKLAHGIAGELDDGDDHNQAKHDTEDGISPQLSCGRAEMFPAHVAVLVCCGHCAVTTSTFLLIWGGITNHRDPTSSNDDSLYLLNLGTSCLQLFMSRHAPADLSFLCSRCPTDNDLVALWVAREMVIVTG